MGSNSKLKGLAKKVGQCCVQLAKDKAACLVIFQMVLGCTVLYNIKVFWLYDLTLTVLCTCPALPLTPFDVIIPHQTSGTRSVVVQVAVRAGGVHRAAVTALVVPVTHPGTGVHTGGGRSTAWGRGKRWGTTLHTRWDMRHLKIQVTKMQHLSEAINE